MYRWFPKNALLTAITSTGKKKGRAQFDIMGNTLIYFLAKSIPLSESGVDFIVPQKKDNILHSIVK